MSVDVAPKLHLQLENPESLLSEARLATLVWPAVRNDQGDVDTCREERVLARPVRGISSTVVDAQYTQAPLH
jgi:hypothetical protein